MWYLKSDTDPRVMYILPNKDITTGRSPDNSVCNFAIVDDASISRKHAILSVSNGNLLVQDLGSRYGTFINDSTDKLETTSQAKHGDIIRFGKMGSVWKVHSVDFITCASTLKGENLENLKKLLQKIGAVFKNDWDDTCNFLTMPAITLTVKVVLALAQGSNIVTTDFWSKCNDAIQNNSALPNPNNFIPQVIESTLNKQIVSFAPKSERKSIFAGKTFVFFSRRQLEMYKPVLLNTSANPLLLSEAQLTNAALCEPDVIVIQFNITSTSQDTQAQRNQINDIVNYLKTAGKRVIADAEIGLAILYCSTNKYCNPNFNFSSEVLKQDQGTNNNPKVLAPESQDQSVKVEKRDNVIINESLTGNDTSSSKRKWSETGEALENVNKKLATGTIPPDNSNESMKRKFDGGNGTENPTKKLAVSNEDDGEMFNFTTNVTNENKTEKKLNFSKPQKRNQDDNAKNDEDDLFNFIQFKKNPTDDKSKSNFFENNRNNHEDDIIEDFIPPRKNLYEDDKVDVQALRGTKLKELMEMNSHIIANSNISNNIKVKKEETDDIDSKMQNLDLGEIVITIKADLIKKEPGSFIGEVNDITINTGVKNFKKFKKVWPMRSQSMTFSKPSTNVIPCTPSTEDISSMSY